MCYSQMGAKLHKTLSLLLRTDDDGGALMIERIFFCTAPGSSGVIFHPAFTRGSAKSPFTMKNMKRKKNFAYVSTSIMF